MNKYDAAVAEARRLRKRSEEDGYRLAELTWEQCAQDGKTFAQWSRDTGIDPKVVRVYVSVWSKSKDLPPAARLPFSEACEMAWESADSPEQARENRTARQVASGAKRLPSERKAEIAAELVKSDPVVAAAASRALEERNAALPAPKVRERTKSDRYSDALTAMRAADAAIDRFANAVSGAEWAAVEADSFETILERWLGAIELIRTGLRSGSWDDELAKLTGSL